MSTYKGIFGKTIKHLSSDPDNLTYEGQIWYNTTEGKFKTVVAAAAWSSGSNLIIAKSQGSGSGTQTSSLYTGGYTTTVVGSTEEYNGSGWSTGGTLGTARYLLAGGGPNTAAVHFGGYVSPDRKNETEEYNGTSWSEQNNLNTARGWSQGTGTQTAALCVAGSVGGSPPATDAVEEYNGTSWTTVTSLPAERYNIVSSGPQTAALSTGGRTGPSSSKLDTSFEYDGTNWTSGGTMNTGRARHGGSGPNTAALVFAGLTGTSPPFPTTTATETYDGTSFSNSANMASPRNLLSSSVNGTNTAAVTFGGESPSSNKTEEFNFTANTVTAAGWSSGTALPSARFNGASAGTTTAGIIAGGELSGGTRTGETVYFDGSSWTAQPATLSPAPNADGVKMAGTQTAAILNSFRGGGSPGPAYTDATSWNGSTWTSIPSTSSSHSFSNLFRNGTPSAATTIGGDNEIGGIQSAVEEYNGTSWAAETALPAGRGNMAAFGTPTAGVIAGGNLGPGTPNRTATALEYDGSSWTTTGSITAAATVVGGGGTQTTGIIFGGYNPTPAATGNTNTYDGTVFSTAPTMATARGGTYSIGDSSGAYAAGGNPPVVTTVEEFTPETTAINIESVDNS